MATDLGLEVLHHPSATPPAGAVSELAVCVFVAGLNSFHMLARRFWWLRWFSWRCGHGVPKVYEATLTVLVDRRACGPRSH
eukprot:479432-Pyramimonas_sp.AAC.1